MLAKANLQYEWRRLLRMPQPVLHMKDVEILMRGFAMLIDGQNYAPPMTRFLNQFAKSCQSMPASHREYLETLYESFLRAASDLPQDTFLNKRNNRFNLALFEAVFTAACGRAFADQRPVEGKLVAEEIAILDEDKEFLEASQKATTQKSNVTSRLNRARALIGAL